MITKNNIIIFENNCWLSNIHSNVYSNVINFITDIAAITKGRLKQSDTMTVKHRTDLYNKLLSESNNQPSVPFEFIPTEYKSNKISVKNIEWYKYVTIDTTNKPLTIYSNLRNDLKYKIENINISHNNSNFKIIIGYVPYKVISHLRTHRAFSFLVESSRNKHYLNNIKFWYPSYWINDFTDYIKHKDINLVNELFNFISNKEMIPEIATMELSDRRLVHFAMSSWLYDKNAWDNLFAVRQQSVGAMSITATTIQQIKKLIYETGN